MRKKYHGSITVEAAVIVPMILWVFMLIMLLLFYYHDKNVVTAIAHETVVMACDREEHTEEEIKAYFNQRIRGKLLLFSQVEVALEVTEKEVHLTGISYKKKIKLKVEAEMSKTAPEKEIRSLRRIWKLGEQIGGES